MIGGTNLIKKNFEGLMIDGGRFINILMMKIIILILNKKIEVKKKYLKLDNLIKEINYDKIGVLSIDVDGNDYWFLKKIVENNILPEVIVIEVNFNLPEKKNPKVNNLLPDYILSNAKRNRFLNHFKDYLSLKCLIFSLKSIFDIPHFKLTLIWHQDIIIKFIWINTLF